LFECKHLLLLMTSAGQSYTQYLNVVHFSTPVLIRHLWQLKTVVFLHLCLICALFTKGLLPIINRPRARQEAFNITTWQLYVNKFPKLWINIELKLVFLYFWILKIYFKTEWELKCVDCSCQISFKLVGRYVSRNFKLSSQLMK